MSKIQNILNVKKIKDTEKSLVYIKNYPAVYKHIYTFSFYFTQTVIL